jgi:hypothetical protein
MTCQECQPLAVDLARGVPPFDVGGAVQRADVLSHIATCKRCAQWLREQEALSDALRAAAAADASLSAPAGVEANVMAAFRARQAQTQRRQPTQLAHRTQPTQRRQPCPALVRPETVVHMGTPEQLARAGRPAWPAGRAAAFAMAAAIVFTTLMLPVSQWLKRSPAANTGVSNTPGASMPSAQPAPTASSTPAPSAPATPPDPSAAVTNTAVTNPAVTGTDAAAIEVLPEKGKKPTTKGRPAPRFASTTRAANVAGGANEFSGPPFVLLPYVEPLRPTEMRHIMRVRMTKAQFAAAELQAAGVEDATVLADVRVGEDGTARAVRIVQ